MTINEKKQLANYIKGLVRESLNEMPLPSGHFQGTDDLPEPKSFNAAHPYAKFGGSAPKMLRIYQDKHPEGVIAINPEVGKNDPNRKVFIPADIIKIWKEDYVAISQKDYDDYCGQEEDFPDKEDDFWEEMGHEQPGRHYEGPDVTTTDYDTFGSPEHSEKDKPAGLNELRQLAESMARQAFAEILSEGRKKKTGKRKNKKEKTSSRDKTVVSRLNSDATNAAHYYYKLYGVENGTEAEKAAARSKGYKKAKGKKNDTGVPYKFTSKERNRLNALLTDRQ